MKITDWPAPETIDETMEASLERIARSTPEWSRHVVVRQLIHSDLPALEWEGQYTHFRRLYADAYQRALQDRAVLWVAELPGAGVIGQLFVQLISPRWELADGRSRAYLYSFRIRPEFRGAGVGSRLLEEAEQDLRRRGFREATLNVGRENGAARKLYERHGYRVAGEEPGRWTYVDEHGQRRQVHEPAWRMRKRLD